jgi:hydroxymethylglutaryl-CoA reductase (NADPH)
MTDHSVLADERDRVPRDPDGDCTAANAQRRREFVREHTGAKLAHVGRSSFDPAMLFGNVENFVGAAQVPIGLAGPLRMRGEHARGDFYVPLANPEGTLVASYNRGMRLLTECGGVRTTVWSRTCSVRRVPVHLRTSEKSRRIAAVFAAAASHHHYRPHGSH